MESRTCPGCGRDLPLTEKHWYPRGTKAKGEVRYRSPCKSCVKERANSKDHREYRAAYDRALAPLRDRYPGEFRDLLDQERSSR